MRHKTREEIEIEFTHAINQAQELENIAGKLSSIANSNVEDVFSNLENGWNGDNAKLFVKKGGGLMKDIFDTADELILVAKSIRNTADIIYKAEKAAIQICY